MAEEKPDFKKEVINESKKLDVGLFTPFYNELYTAVFHYLSLPDFGRLGQVSQFFREIVRRFIFFSESTKDIMSAIFRTSGEEKPLTKWLLEKQIRRLPEKVNLSGLNLRGIRYYSWIPSENVTLKEIVYGLDGEDVTRLNRYPTTLLNKAVIELIEYYRFWCKNSLTDFAIYNQHGVKVNSQEFDFIEHCILYHFKALPDKPEAKSTLRCFFDIDDYKIQFVLGVGCSDKETLENMKTQLSHWNNKWLNFLPEQEFSKLKEQYGDNGHFTIGLSYNDVANIFLINPIRITIYLLDNPDCFAEEDFKESCEVLLAEIKKFRGFSSVGISDKDLDWLESMLNFFKNEKDLIEQQIKTFTGTSTDTYHYVNKILGEKINNMEQQNSLHPGLKSRLQAGYKAIRKQQAIRAIEGYFADHPYDKPGCQKTFKAIINDPELDVASRTGIFSLFKDHIELNRHRNPSFDAFFGIKNTTSWREVWKEIRDDAKQKLFNEIDNLPKETIDEKRHLFNVLDSACYQPLFRDHRNNFFFEGAFGRTQAVRDIREKINAVKETLKILPRNSVV